MTAAHPLRTHVEILHAQAKNLADHLEQLLHTLPTSDIDAARSTCSIELPAIQETHGAIHELLTTLEDEVLHVDAGTPEDYGESGAEDDVSPSASRVRLGERPIPQALWVGPPSEAESQLEDLEAFLEGELGARVGWTARELCTLPKTPGRHVAIPHRSLWANMIPTLVVYHDLRRELDVPFSLRGYRPPDYNRKVGGSRNSTHQWFGALDVYAPVPNRQELARAAARYWHADPGLPLGLGIYGHPFSSNIHIDVGLRRRTWAQAKTWIAEVAS